MYISPVLELSRTPMGFEQNATAIYIESLYPASSRLTTQEPFRKQRIISDEKALHLIHLGKGIEEYS